MLFAGHMLQGRYQIVRTLGQGGMGAVYLAADRRLNNKWVAVKEMSDAAIADPLQKQQAIAAFHQEAQMLACLDHPNVPRISDFFTEASNHYMVMDFVQGETLEMYLQRHGMVCDEQTVRAWALQLCNVLEYLHNQTPPVIFRDLKPGNIMLTPDGQLKLIDFGIARFFKAGRPGDTLVMGTPGYAAPEQYGHSQTDARSDIYSLGVLLHHLLTLHDPALTPFALPPAQKLNPAISSGMTRIIARAVELQPAARYQSVGELRQDLLAASSSSHHWATASLAPRWLPLWGGIIAAVILLLAGAVLGSRLFGQSATVTPAPSPAVSSGITAPASPTTMQVNVETTAPKPNTDTQPSDAIVVAMVTLASASTSLLTDTPLPPHRPTRASTPPSTDTPLPPPTHTYTPAPSPTDTLQPMPDYPQGLIAYSTGPDGSWQIAVYDPATNRSWLQPGLPPNSGVPAFLPAGNRLGFRSKATGYWQIYTINTDGSDLRQLTLGAYDNMEAAWSPDGRLIAFVSTRDGNKEIYRMDADGSNQQRLTVNPGHDDDPSWSPDGRWLVFESLRGNRLDIYKMRSDGSEVTRLTSGGLSNTTPAWSPDGRWIAFERKDGNASNIWVMNPDGGSLRQLTFEGRINWRPAWSPDSQQIAFTSDRDGTMAVWVVPLDLRWSPQRISPLGGFDAAWSSPH